MNTGAESALKDPLWEKNPLLHWGVEPASAPCQTWCLSRWTTPMCWFVFQILAAESNHNQNQKDKDGHLLWGFEPEIWSSETVAIRQQAWTTIGFDSRQRLAVLLTCNLLQHLHNKQMGVGGGGDGNVNVHSTHISIRVAYQECQLPVLVLAS